MSGSDQQAVVELCARSAGGHSVQHVDVGPTTALISWTVKDRLAALAARLSSALRITGISTPSVSHEWRLQHELESAKSGSD
jgi:hypothetical protein